MKLMNWSKDTNINNIVKKKSFCLCFEFLSKFLIQRRQTFCLFIINSIRFHLQWIVSLPPIYYTTNKCSFLFFCRGGPRWNKVQDSLSMWERRVAHFVWYWGIHLSDTSQLWPVFHCHLQQTRLHRLERQLYVAPNHKSTANKVRSCLFYEFKLG